MSNKTIDLAAFDGTFQQEATEDRGDFDSLPDGKYQVAIVARDFEGAPDPTAPPKPPAAPLDARQCLRFANRDAVHWVSPDKTLAGPIVAEIEVTR